MINLIIGIAIGAAFSKFWIAIWNKIVAYYETTKTEEKK